MAISCAICERNIGRYEDYICCRSHCNGNFHIKCVGQSVIDYTSLKQNNKLKEWICKTCLNSEQVAITLEDTSEKRPLTSNTTVDDIIAAAVNKPVNLLSDNVISVLQEEINKLKFQNKTLIDEINKLKTHYKTTDNSETRNPVPICENIEAVERKGEGVVGEKDKDLIPDVATVAQHLSIQVGAFDSDTISLNTPSSSSTIQEQDEGNANTEPATKTRTCEKQKKRCVSIDDLMENERLERIQMIELREIRMKIEKENLEKAELGKQLIKQQLMAAQSINKLSKTELSYQLAIRGVTQDATVEVMRSTLRGLIKLEKSSSFVAPTYPSAFDEDKDTIETDVKAKAAGRASSTINPFRTLTQIGESDNEDSADDDNISDSRPNVSAAMVKSIPVSKWNLTYSGNNQIISLNAFLERVEETRIARNISHKVLFISALDLFTEIALIWYRVNRKHFHNWNELTQGLREEFLPVNYDDKLLEEVKHRTQGQKESIGLYLSVMSNLFLGLVEITSVSQLQKLCRQLEARRVSVESFVPPPGKNNRFEPDLAYAQVTTNLAQLQVNPSESAVINVNNDTSQSRVNSLNCWNCGRSGHRSSQCRQPHTKHYYRCGRPQVAVSTCSNCSKNFRPTR
ncbi:zinc finger fyve/phd-type [Holotrichia oblita]|uniref:Zinc finger fyve/phd-type n=1 Tax=Holotrichia oblita TaxID=644536 RepID=A0ACB9T8S9_HOLOL|nr:zinc finger fyve/phd-type [Holotrichia oblita]